MLYSIICPQKESKWRSEYEELELTKQREFGSSGSLVCLSDTSDARNAFPGELVAALGVCLLLLLFWACRVLTHSAEAAAPYLQLLLVTDQYKREDAEFTKMVKMVFTLRQKPDEWRLAVRVWAL